MTLTVPTSNRAAGREARVVPIEGGQAGAAVAGLGEVMNQVGRRIEADQLQYQAQRARVDFTRDLGEARLAAEEIGDPDEMDRFWVDRTAELRDRYLGEGGGLDPRVRRDLEPAFDELANRHALQVGQNALAARRARTEATWLEYADTTATQGAAADPETRDTLLAGAWDMLGEMVASGQINEADRYQRFQALIGDVDNATAIRMIGESPEAFLEAQAAGAFEALGPEANARYEVQAKNAVAAAEKEAARAAEQAAKDAEKAIGDRLGEMEDIYRTSDRPVADEKWLGRPDVQAHPDYARTMAAKGLREAGIDLRTMTPDEIAAELERVKREPIVFKYQAAEEALLQEELAAAEDAWAKDPVAAARDRLGVAPAALPLAGGRGELATAIRDRLALSDDLQRDGYTDRIALLSDEETAALAAATGIEADPAERARIAGELAIGLAGRPKALAAVSDDPVFRHVGGMLAAGGSGRVAEDVFRGQQVLEAGTAILPPVKDRTGEAFAELDAVFASVPGGEAIQGTIMQAADALYARRKRVDGPVDDIDGDAYRQAVHDVLGGTGAVDSAEARGGIQEVRGRETILPSYATADRVEFALNAIGYEDTQNLLGAARRSFSGDRFAETLQAISLGGNLPSLGGKPVTREDLDDGAVTIRPVDADTYVFVRRLSGGAEDVIVDETGEEYRFSMRRLLREVRP